MDSASAHSKLAKPDNVKIGYYCPSYELMSEYQVHDFRKSVESRYNVTLPDYKSLHRWSCDNYSDFWEHLMEYTNIYLGNRYSQVIDLKKSIADFPCWFEGSTLNYTENIIERGEASRVAIVSVQFINEAMVLTEKTYSELRKDVYCLASSLREMGLKVGDHVCGYLPNTYFTTIAMFATAAIGAVWCSASVDFGPNGVLDRFKQVKPRVLFAVSSVTYKRKRFDLTDKLKQIVEGLPSLEKVIVNHCDEYKVDHARYNNEKLFVNMDEFIVKPDTGHPLTFIYERVPFNHPLFVMFSSGTTGLPKGIVHSHGGTLLKHVEEHILQGDSSENDRMLFYTTCGWMMWNWTMSFLFCGGSLVLYDESPLEPDTHVLIKIAVATKSTVIGMGAKLYDEYTRLKIDFQSMYDLSKLRLVYSTGSPLKSATFEFINLCIKPGVLIGSISGGTDIIGCFMGSSPTLRVYPGECQCLYLGMDIVAFDPEGKSVEDEQGELICLTPFPSMPTHFINDENFAKYKKAYFQRFPNVWAHGDFCQINSETGGVVMLGRSDATLNRGGVRIGTAEIYAVVETFDEIEDSIVAGQQIPQKEDEDIVLFVKMANGKLLDDVLRKSICASIRTMMSPRHVPNNIFSVNDIPYTNSGKKVEIAIKQVINGAEAEQTSSIRNPECLALYRNFVQSTKAN
ncbi:unnamed protein product [Auanema sp. JU1783]|nr:unnamed protein product [Auanema sp. JU1783]